MRPSAILSEGRVGVLDKLHEVVLVPGSCLGGRLVGVLVAAEVVEAFGRSVAGAVGLTAGLDPDEGVGQLGASLGREALTEAGALDVAPVWTKAGRGQLSCCDKE